MWEFVEAVKGINDACINIGLKHSPNHPTPIIAGNVSFYNESKNNAIPPSPIISCLGKIKNINKSIAMSFKNEKSEIIMIGKRKNELGGSAFYSLYNQLGKNIPKPSLKEVKNQIFGITDCIDNELIISCHDISDGGLATTLCEMTFENLIGCETIIDSKISNEAILFSETGGFIIETKKENVNSIKSIFNQYDIDIYNIGYTGGKKIKINNLVNISVLDAKKSWDNGLREKL